MTLFEAVEAADAELLDALATDHPDINEVFAGGRTALIEAAARGHVTLVRVLLAHRAEPQWRDDDQETALLKAAVNGHHDVVRLLWPLGTDDDRSMAQALLGAHRVPFDPDEYQGAAPVVPEWRRNIASAAARVSKLLGNERAHERYERVERSERNLQLGLIGRGRPKP